MLVRSTVYLIKKLIQFIEFFEYLHLVFISKDQLIDFIDLSDKDIKIKTKDGYAKIKTIFYTIPQYENQISVWGPKYFATSADHKIEQFDDSDKLIFKAASESNEINIKGVQIGNIRNKLTNFKLSMIDLEMENESKSYEIDGLLNVHNCVRSDTMVKIKVEDQEIELPIFKLHYKYRKNPTIFDFIEYYILKVLFYLYQRKKN